LVAAPEMAVDELATAVIATFCQSLEPQANSCVGDSFRHYWNAPGRIDRLPGQLPTA